MPAPDKHAGELEEQLRGHAAVQDEQLLEVLLVLARQHLVQVVEEAELAAVEPRHERVRVHHDIAAVDEAVALRDEVEHELVQSFLLLILRHCSNNQRNAKEASSAQQLQHRNTPTPKRHNVATHSEPRC